MGHHSANISDGQGAAQLAAGLEPLPLPEASNHGGGIAPEDDPRFPGFYQAMGNETIQNGGVDDLLKRFTAWKMFQHGEKDPTKLRVLVLKAESNSKPQTTPTKTI